MFPTPRFRCAMTNTSDSKSAATDFEKYDYLIADRDEDDVSEDYFQLVCPIDGCEAAEKFRGLSQIRDSDWTGLSVKDEFLKGGGVIKESYCPVHHLEETYDPSRDMGSHQFGEGNS